MGGTPPPVPIFHNKERTRPMKDPKEIVAVKCEGGFTEWYSPFFKEPYNDNQEYRDYYNEHIIAVQPVIGPSLNDGDDDECINDDLQFLAERMCSDAKDWAGAIDEFKRAVNSVLRNGFVCSLDLTRYGMTDTIKITPYKREEMPKPNENHLKVYGPYADLMRERVAAI